MSAEVKNIEDFSDGASVVEYMNNGGEVRVGNISVNKSLYLNLKSNTVIENITADKAAEILLALHNPPLKKQEAKTNGMPGCETVFDLGLADFVQRKSKLLADKKTIEKTLQTENPVASDVAAAYKIIEDTKKYFAPIVIARIDYFKKVPSPSQFEELENISKQILSLEDAFADQQSQKEQVAGMKNTD